MLNEKQILIMIWNILKDADNDEDDMIVKTYALIEHYMKENDMIKENGIND